MLKEFLLERTPSTKITSGIKIVSASYFYNISQTPLKLITVIQKCSILLLGEPTEDRRWSIWELSKCNSWPICQMPVINQISLCVQISQKEKLNINQIANIYFHYRPQMQKLSSSCNNQLGVLLKLISFCLCSVY